MITKTELFSGVIPILAGLRESSVFAVPNGVKRPDVPLTLEISIEQTNFPVGRTMLSLSISTDGGASFRQASMTCDAPANEKGPAPHFWTMGFALGAGDIPTHMKYATNAPSGFSALTTVSCF